MNLLQKIKVAMGLQSAWQKAQQQLNATPHQPMKLKPGISTSEFWTTVGFGLGSVILGALGMVDGNVAVASATILGAIYTAARGLAKSKAE
jgi:hypothetical protein